MNDILSHIIAVKRGRLAEALSAVSLDEIRLCALRATRVAHGLEHALGRDPGIHIIAEIKRASPSRGVIHSGLDAAAAGRDYAASGATAISVLTEQDHFCGSLDDLREVRGAVDLPVLRKDFLLDEYQIFESAAAGADAVLLIAAVVDDQTLGHLISLSEECGLDALVEVHSEVELHRATSAGARLIGINNRDLRTFDVDLSTTEHLAPMVNSGQIAVAESGINSGADIARLSEFGVRNFLVGESLVRSVDRKQLLSELILAGRAS